MKIETILTPTELPALAQRDLRATACVVFDVLRATSTFVTALHHGAKAIIPVSQIAEALEIKKNRPEVLLGGERNGIRISADGIDFDLGNSPREYTPEKVRGKTIVSTTTNGTRALRACVGAKIILASSFLNLGATAEFLRREQAETILLVCAGTGKNQADEDVLAAGALIELLTARGDARPTFSDSTKIALKFYAESKFKLAEVVFNSENARRLLAISELRDDVAFCLQRDIFPLVPKMEADGMIRKS
ncbi:MAG TPA: 2-phosphosulfolactate phosphatase [Verrucomicrobiae bacterium]|nr:2-phosphosulfolactate phosphatase [Verrucomicrobiae bacterium]